MSSVFNDGTKHDFDLEFVLHALQRCYLNDGTVLLSEYLTAYHELCRFFKLTGRLFGFVARDLEGKIRVLEMMQKADESQNYQSVQSMLEYECGRGTAHTNDFLPSGSRTLLRLHWAMEFIVEFMDRVCKSTDDDTTSQIAAEVYKKTLSNHHPWFTRQIAALAMHLLPSRKQLIQVMCKQDYETVLQLLNRVVESGRQVYNTTQALYAERNLLNIP
ncbi:hypothetical protein CHS0354_028623 [Potamilus streckersoni]|uniref:Glycolipid transfer protein domain-containing protein n=1 Tax=Potamilus streckersoni TaxID=2493646 RepID=A0AAE0VKC7_9BIVA|nr:hypothetical protein CHS0354_028623 [Potamilus streckersoni]